MWNVKVKINHNTGYKKKKSKADFIQGRGLVQWGSEIG